MASPSTRGALAVTGQGAAAPIGASSSSVVASDERFHQAYELALLRKRLFKVGAYCMEAFHGHASHAATDNTLLLLLRVLCRTICSGIRLVHECNR